MKKLFASIISALLLMLMLTGTVFAAPTSEKEHLRLKGSLHAVEVGDASDYPIIHVVANGSGLATHLGKFTYSYTVDIHELDGLGNAVGTLYYTIVAANGDKLYSVGDGVGAPVPGLVNIFRVVEKHTITGGTGRFAGATGKFTVDRLISTGGTSGTLDGYIDLADHE